MKYIGFGFSRISRQRKQLTMMVRKMQFMSKKDIFKYLRSYSKMVPSQKTYAIYQIATDPSGLKCKFGHTWAIPGTSTSLRYIVEKKERLILEFRKEFNNHLNIINKNRIRRSNYPNSRSKYCVYLHYCDQKNCCT